MVAGAGSAGGVLAVCIGKLKNLFKKDHAGLFQTTKENGDGRQHDEPAENSVAR
jgi:hypothetical protein